MLASLLVSVAGCVAPDRPRELPDPLSSDLVQMVDPEVQRQFRVSPGVWYRYLWSGDRGWAIHVLEVDLGRCDLAVRVLPAGDPPPGADGRERVSDLAGRIPGAIAAVNADFFTPEGRPLGWEVVEGTVLSRGRRGAVAWSPSRGIWIGSPSGVERDVWLRPGTHAVGGDPILLLDGDVVGDLDVESRPSFAAARHPRTALGYRHGDRRTWLVVVDGRQEGYSEGMTLPSLARLMAGLGAEDALNLDGGGSSVMVMRREVVSRPSDPEGERAVANGLAIVSRPEGCGYRGDRLSQRQATPR